jgi:hypothetical protein
MLRKAPVGPSVWRGVGGDVGPTRIRRSSAEPTEVGPVVGIGGGPIGGELASRITRGGGGEPLEPRARARMERGFGASFADVRVHADSELPRQVAADAFTVGAHVHFAPGRFGPAASGGERLLAHELAHVVQQGSAGPCSMSNAERTSRIARRVDGGESASSPSFSATRGGVVQRDLSTLAADPGVLSELALEDKVERPGVDGRPAKKVDEEWADLGAELKTLFPDTEEKPIDPQVKSLGYSEMGVYRARAVAENQTTWGWTEIGEGGTKCGGAILDKIGDVLIHLMYANGQMKYVEAQPWFHTKKWQLDIDVNYYPDRGLKQARELTLHKDSGGNNIFVNLIFNNNKTIPATELLLDTSDPSPERAKLQSKILPPEHIAEMNRARLKLRADETEARLKNDGKLPDISGGVTGPMSYLSWVDDLLWHDTPQMAPRALDSEGSATTVFDQLKKLLGASKSATLPRPYYPSLYVISAKEGTLLYETTGKLTPPASVKSERDSPFPAKDLKALADGWWEAYSQGTAADFWNDCRLVTDWSVALHTYQGEANAHDPRLLDNLPAKMDADDPRHGESLQIMEDVEGMKDGRRRANSRAEMQKKVQAAFDDNEGVPRSFIRTWVRIVPWT